MAVFLFAVPNVIAAEFRSPIEIIQAEGQFVFSDGSSYYLFKKEGTFISEPLGLSGRVITGTWTCLDNREFVIQGRWSWINGLSARDDYREMRMIIGQAESAETIEQLSPVSSLRRVKIFKVYFAVEELHRIPKPEVRSNQ
jgi:hypothetical protein